MVYREFDFEYTHQMQKIKASCTVMDARHFPGHIMYRVLTVQGKKEYVEIFYKVDQPDRMFYWFPKPKNNSILKSIAKALESFT